MGSIALDTEQKVMKRLVLERVNRAGQVLSSSAFDHNLLNVGRGYDQHYRLEDEYVDAAHLRLQLNLERGTVTCIDLGSVNGVWVDPKIGKRYRVQGTAVIHSGDIVIIGATQLRVCLPFQPVPPARLLTKSYMAASFIGGWPVALVAAVALFSFALLDGFLGLPLKENTQRYAIDAFYVCLATAAYAGVWSMVGRAARGDGRFYLQFAFAAGFALLLAGFEYMQAWLAYHFAIPSFWLLVQKIAPAVCLFWLVYINMRLATRVRYWGSYGVALVIPTVMVSTLLLDFFEKSKTTYQVPYQKALTVPSLNLRRTSTSAEFVARQAGYQSTTEQNENSED